MPQTTVLEESVMIKPSVQTIYFIIYVLFVCFSLFLMAYFLFEDHLRVIIRNRNSTLFNSIVLYNVYFDNIAQKI